MAHEKSHSEVTAALKRIGQYRGILSSRQLKILKGQIIAGDIRGAEKGLRRMLPAIHLGACAGRHEAADIKGGRNP